MKRTKIVCTLGPSTDEFDKIKRLLKAGMNVARLNMSHGTLESHQATLNLVKKARKELCVPCAIMVDTCGPELRIGSFENGKATLEKGANFYFFHHKQKRRRRGSLLRISKTFGSHFSKAEVVCKQWTA